MGETKPKASNSLRSPQPKKKLGLSVPTALRLPHDDLIKPEETQTPVTPVTRVPPVTPVTPVTGVTGDAAPKKDFTRVANSVVRDAIPAGLFTGKGKQLYDYLYSQTRGAIVPKRSERIPTDKVMRGAGMTRHTYRAHLQRLVLSGLVNVEEKGGEHGGNLFTVNLPEEVGIERGDRGDRGDRGVTVQDLHMVQGSESDRGDRGLSVENTGTYDTPKTSFKTIEKFFDDDAFAKSLREVERELTGKESSAQAWESLFELLAAELKIAAARTTVSSVPAFLTEHLRRRLWKLDKKQLEEEVVDEKSTEPPIDASKCLDCGATGWWYPNGPDKGVARCRHQKLR
ncbi:MAG TPA: hypothetical protein VK388_05185 [Pyrinomonadaceae bacterium]|nr:hypothetical protein [Pyrinomonadaceae bacterium]